MPGSTTSAGPGSASATTSGFGAIRSQGVRCKSFVQRPARPSGRWAGPAVHRQIPLALPSPARAIPTSREKPAMSAGSAGKPCNTHLSLSADYACVRECVRACVRVRAPMHSLVPSASCTSAKNVLARSYLFFFCLPLSLLLHVRLYADLLSICVCVCLRYIGLVLVLLQLFLLILVLLHLLFLAIRQRGPLTPHGTPGRWAAAV